MDDEWIEDAYKLSAYINNFIYADILKKLRIGIANRKTKNIERDRY